MAGAALATAGSANPNHIGSTISKINGEGFRICKSMGNSGYSAVARGTVNDSGGFFNDAGFRYFQVRTCFQTRAKCDHFISRIHHTIAGIERLSYAGCESRHG